MIRRMLRNWRQRIENVPHRIWPVGSSSLPKWMTQTFNPRGTRHQTGRSRGLSTSPRPSRLIRWRFTSSSRRSNFCAAIAAKDFEQAEEKWQEIATFTGQVRPWTPQFGHAAEQLANHKLESSSVDPMWIDVLLNACIAESAAAEPSDKNMTSALFRASFQPAMRRIKPMFRRSPVEEPKVPNSLGSKRVIEFCDRFVTLAATPARRDDYKSLLTWWDDVEVAAVIAGQQAKTRQDKTRLFSIAADAFIHARYEQQDDMRFESIVETLESYHRAAVALGSDTSSDFIAARIIDQRGFRETDPEKSMQMYTEAIAKYDAVITECVKQADAQAGRCTSLSRRYADSDVKTGPVRRRSTSTESDRRYPTCHKARAELAFRHGASSGNARGNIADHHRHPRLDARCQEKRTAR